MKFTLPLVWLICITSVGNAQQRDTTDGRFNYYLEAQAGYTSNDQVPFWLRSNVYGSVPEEGISSSMIGRVSRDYSGKSLLDWGFAIEGRANLGRQSSSNIVEGYVKGKLGIWQLKIGRSREIIGLVDSTLSSGAFGISGNALGIPKVQISIPDYYEVPFLKQVLSIKGTFSHGWMGRLPIQYSGSSIQNATSYFHESSVYGRIGRPNWRLHLLGGINHEVIWGNDKAIFQEQYNLNQLEAFYYVITGKKYLGANDISKIGNHLGSIDIGAEYDFPNFKLSLYRQNFYEKGAIRYLANISDGLNGVSITNKKANGSRYWKKFLLELFYSKNQAGEENARKTPSGPEYYYNHVVYTNGYSYKGLGLGNPLITPAKYARKGLPHAPVNYFINNRVFAVHSGAEGHMFDLDYRIKLTYSRNYGDYRASDIGFWFDGDRFEREPQYGIFKAVNQFSGFIEVDKRLRDGFQVGGALAYDRGALLYNSIGAMLRLSKRW